MSERGDRRIGERARWPGPWRGGAVRAPRPRRVPRRASSGWVGSGAGGGARGRVGARTRCREEIKIS